MYQYIKYKQNGTLFVQKVKNRLKISEKNPNFETA